MTNNSLIARIQSWQLMFLQTIDMLKFVLVMHHVAISAICVISLYVYDLIYISGGGGDVDEFE